MTASRFSPLRGTSAHLLAVARLAFVPAAFATAVVAMPAFARADGQTGSGDATGAAAAAAVAGAPEATPAQKEEAQVHFRKARELYSTGAYREAAAELESALKLDPHAKDLVFNLGVVMEKLGRIDEAIAQFRHYETMDVTATERGKAEATLRRLEGAKRETVTPAPTTSGTGASSATPAPTDTSATPAPPSSSSAPPESAHNGRIDGATIAAGAIGVVGLGVGTVFGVVALSKHPSSFATGSGHSYDDYLNAKSAASTDATLSTVGFAVGVVGIAAAAVLYLVRPATSSSDAAVSFGVGNRGALLGGSF